MNTITKGMLDGISQDAASFHKVVITPETAEAMVRLIHSADGITYKCCGCGAISTQEITKVLDQHTYFECECGERCEPAAHFDERGHEIDLPGNKL